MSLKNSFKIKKSRHGKKMKFFYQVSTSMNEEHLRIVKT